MLAFIKKEIEKKCFFTCDMAKGYLVAARFSDRKVRLKSIRYLVDAHNNIMFFL